jgi:hypothetical protein
LQIGMISAAAFPSDGQTAPGPLHDLLEYLTDYDGNKPVVLVVGSSFTQQGVDPDLLAETLGASGRSIAVLPFAIGGLSHLERLYYLREYLAHAKRMSSGSHATRRWREMDSNCRFRITN